MYSPSTREHNGMRSEKSEHYNGPVRHTAMERARRRRSMKYQLVEIIWLVEGPEPSLVGGLFPISIIYTGSAKMNRPF